ncbi:MAG: iron complex outermembrane receptor protein [Pseudomonadales bacterium]|jgi:iron complex outermembrane receptor protein
MNKSNFKMSLLAMSIIASGQAVANDALTLEEVIVTAQKKEQSLVTTPLAVNIIDGSALSESGFFQIDELDKLTSGVEIRFEGTQNDGVGIRGVGTFARQSAPPRVATYVDNYFIGSQTSFAFANTYDIKQVQILRGPQGTLYGQPSPTGALLIETADPDMEKVTGYVQGSYLADPGGYNAQAAISVPVIKDQLAVRLAVLSDERETGAENITRNFDQEVGRDGARLKVLWEPTDGLSIGLGYHYLRTKDSDTSEILESTSPLSDFQLDAEDRTILADAVDSVIDKKDILTTLKIDWALDWGTVSWFSGNFTSDNLRLSDDDSTNYVGLNQIADTRFNHNIQHELRITMSPTDNWETQFGGFYQDSDSETTVSSIAGEATSGGAGVFDISLKIPTQSKVKAVFSHNEFKFSEETTLTVGLRYNIFDSSASNNIDQDFYIGSTLGSDNSISDPLFIFPFALGCPSDPTQTTPPCTVGVSEEDKEWTGTIKLAHTFSDELNIYATLDHGFRPGAPNFDVNGALQATPQDPDSDFNSFAGETVDSFEIGAKGDLWGGRGRYSSALFYSVYEDYQVRPTVLVWNAFGASGAGEQTTISNADVNVDEARQIGIEGELTYLLTENLELFGSVTYAKIEFTDGEIPCTDPSQAAVDATNRFNTCNADGGVASAQPELFATFRASYTQPIEDIGMEFFVNGLLNYRDDVEVPGDTLGNFSSDSFTTVDIVTGLRSDNGWQAQVFVKNITDEAGVLARRPIGSTGTTAAAFNGGTALYNEVSLTPARSVGVTASYSF